LEIRQDAKGPITEVFFLGPETFYVYRRPEEFLRTTDGGESFQTLSTRVPLIDEPTRSVAIWQEGFFFLDPLHGWAIAADLFVGTTDGGETWWRERMRVPRPHRLWMFDVQRGIAVGGSKGIAQTNDGGGRWEAIPNTPRIRVVRCLADGSFCVGCSTLGTKDVSMYVSRDRGTTWEVLEAELLRDEDEVRDVQLLGETGVVIVGRWSHGLTRFLGTPGPMPTMPPARAFMLRWDGSRWQRTDYPDLPRGFWTVQFVTETEVWASSGDNGLLHSTDGGETWTFVPDYYHQIAALTPQPTALPTPPVQ
jgi:photosystem II stability/assembly factor-like uncharacterized protein